MSSSSQSLLSVTVGTTRPCHLKLLDDLNLSCGRARPSSIPTAVIIFSMMAVLYVLLGFVDCLKKWMSQLS